MKKITVIFCACVSMAIFAKNVCILEVQLQETGQSTIWDYCADSKKFVFTTTNPATILGHKLDQGYQIENVATVSNKLIYTLLLKPKKEPKNEPKNENLPVGIEMDLQKND